MREYVLCLLAAAAVTYLLTPVVRRIALRFGVMAEVPSWAFSWRASCR